MRRERCCQDEQGCACAHPCRRSGRRLACLAGEAGGVHRRQGRAADAGRPTRHRRLRRCRLRHGRLLRCRLRHSRLLDDGRRRRRSRRGGVTGVGVTGVGVTGVAAQGVLVIVSVSMVKAPAPLACAPANNRPTTVTLFSAVMLVCAITVPTKVELSLASRSFRPARERRTPGHRRSGRHGCRSPRSGWMPTGRSRPSWNRRRASASGRLQSPARQVHRRPCTGPVTASYRRVLLQRRESPRAAFSVEISRSRSSFAFCAALL